jgi:hypothetical protein
MGSLLHIEGTVQEALGWLDQAIGELEDAYSETKILYRDMLNKHKGAALTGKRLQDIGMSLYHAKKIKELSTSLLDIIAPISNYIAAEREMQQEDAQWANDSSTY